MSATIHQLPPRGCPDHPTADLEPGFGLAGGGYGTYLCCGECGRVISKTQEEGAELKVVGLSREGGNNRVLLVSLSAVPSDDDLRSLHDHLRTWSPS